MLQLCCFSTYMYVAGCRNSTIMYEKLYERNDSYMCFPVACGSPFLCASSYLPDTVIKMAKTMKRLMKQEKK